MDLELLKELYDKDLSNREIAKQLSCHHKTVAYNLEKLNLRAKRFSSSTPRDSDEDKVCTKCAQSKPANQYQRGRKGQEDEYEFSYCNSCRNKQVYESLNGNFDRYLKDRYNRWRRQSLKDGLIFTITFEEIKEIYELQFGNCFYTGVEMVWGVKIDRDRNIISIDKIVPALGYIKGNVVLCTNRANTIKCDQTLEELKEWMPEWYRKINTCEWL